MEKSINKRKMNSKEFEERKELIELQHQRDTEKHLMKMKEFEYLRESDCLHHERELERGRIKSAQIQKTQMRKGMGYKY